ncbi:amidase family protein [Variovorax ginsengisoli]|uniref:Amidase family protein n=1 Tax=Variovorax ginsengisoli TaxID=363844 RepID=A0ABT8S3E2_9BURK|nr:amidase family protein [Variovorax ginsengisoli]MDN8613322.1 amidase family protein [Variovorax ginsengisoli]MDO1532492.1 amidase family protein [Variovorax ginsengisoli]
MPYATTRELVEALHSGKTSAATLLADSIARIEQFDPALNAVAVRDFERARVAALAADAALARGDRRPLLGVPVTVKEAFNVEGLPTTWGIPGTGQPPAAEDAVLVRRLKAAGAIVIGKTNVAMQLADWQSSNPVYGRTNNPWDLARTPGGSSGGGAAALAAGYVSLEFGSDLVGSLRVPAHFCGVFAHKPTHGLVPMRGSAPPGTPALSADPWVDLAVVGPMARSAADLALALDAIAGPDDAQAIAYRLALPPSRHAALADFRVLLLDTHPLVPTSAAVRSALQRLADGLARAGCRVERGSPLLPDLARVASLWGQLLWAQLGADMPGAEAGISHRDWIHADRMRAATAHRWRALFAQWDVVLCPVSPTPAFPHDPGEMETRRLRIDDHEIAYKDQSPWSSLATLTGLPATAMPIGLSEEGLPVGVQIIGPYLEDRTTIAFAEAVERAFGGFVPPPGYGG